jgi:hypothetical protein
MNLPFSRSRFLRLNCIDITKNIRNLMVTEIKTTDGFRNGHYFMLSDYQAQGAMFSSCNVKTCS